MRSFSASVEPPAITQAFASVPARQQLHAATLPATAALCDGTRVRLRAIRPDDKERLSMAFHRLSPRSVYRRFFHPVKELTPSVLRELTELDFHDRVGLVLAVPEGGGERLVGVGRFARLASDSERAEFAITVADDHQHRGAGTLLLQRLVEMARADGVREFVAHVLEDNRGMLEVIRRANLPCRQTSEGGIRRVVMSLVDGSGARLAGEAAAPVHKP